MDANRRSLADRTAPETPAPLYCIMLLASVNMSVWHLELVRAFSQNRAAVFVGAGVSKASGLPDWKSLIEPLKQEIDDCPDDATTLDIAQYFINDNRQRLLAERLSERLNRPDVQPSEIHRLLVRLPLDRIYTTNFDDLLERAYEQEKRGRVRRVTKASNLSLDSSRLNVIKLHGDIEDPETIVITAEDFEDYFDTHSAVAQQLSADLLQRTILFVGYSFTDPDMRAIMRRVSRDTGKFSRNHFIIQINPKKPVITELKRRGLICIELDGKPTASQCVLDWFQRLEERLKKEAPPASATAKLTNNNLPPPPPDLVGRTEDISATLTALESNRIVAVTGANGIGKTSVALAVAHELSERKKSHFDYVIWVTAREGSQPFVALNEVLNAIGVTLEFPKIAQTPTSEIDKKRDQVNFLLQNRKTLVVLDNFELMADNQLIQWVRSVPAPSRVLITSAREHPELGPDTTNHPLRGLTADHALSLLQHFLKDFDLTDVTRATEPALRRIIEVTCGNPQAMRLALGVLQSDRFRFDNVIAKLEQQKNNVDGMFQQLFEWSWGMLPFAAEQLLIVTALFPGVGSIRRDAIETSTGLKRDEFEGALHEVLRFRLLNHEDDGRYVIHPRTRQFALAKVPNWGKFADEARERCAKYYLRFVKETIVRRTPDVYYWNVLVTDAMNAIDPEWPILRELMDWAKREGRGDLLVEFVMLLVHYMDSRFLNAERLEYVLEAVETLSETDRFAEEALLRIDALGWTYVEESHWPEAHAQIDAGVGLTKRLASTNPEKANLLALANAWKARALIEENKSNADDYIKAALDDISVCSPWIRVRVYMAAGDIKQKQRRPDIALHYYEKALSSANEYGGEGGGYQINPRIGMSLIGVGKVDKAEEKFQTVHDLKGIPIGNLYGEYGLALIARHREQSQEAASRVEHVRNELQQRTSSNLLLTLLTELQDQLHKCDQGT